MLFEYPMLDSEWNRAECPTEDKELCEGCWLHETVRSPVCHGECSLCHGLALWSPVFASFLQVFVPPKVRLVSAAAQFHSNQVKV